MSKEIVICAAIRMADGYLARGHRHGDCIRHINEHYDYLKKRLIGMEQFKDS